MECNQILEEDICWKPLGCRVATVVWWRRDWASNVIGRDRIPLQAEMFCSVFQQDEMVDPISNLTGSFSSSSFKTPDVMTEPIYSTIRVVVEVTWLSNWKLPHVYGKTVSRKTSSRQHGEVFVRRTSRLATFSTVQMPILRTASRATLLLRRTRAKTSGGWEPA